MANVDATVNGLQLLRENGAGGVTCLALFSCTYGAYTSGDTARILNVGTVIQAERRDGKTITIRNSRIACLAETGLSGSTQVYAGTFAVSGSNITHKLENAAGSDTTFASGNPDRPIMVCVSYETS